MIDTTLKTSQMPKTYDIQYEFFSEFLIEFFDLFLVTFLKAILFHDPYTEREPRGMD